VRTAFALATAAALAGCSDLYTDRREHIHLSAGEAIAANRVTHMVDPWPPYAGKREIVFNGDKMQAAAERYRTGKVIAPQSPTTSSAQMGAQQNGSGGGNP
jgi:hypothetical protein